MPFFKTSDPLSLEMNRNGHGLGLSICKKIVNVMGGTLDVISNLGVGSMFTFTLKTVIKEADLLANLVSSFSVNHI
jgi:two-component system capsular synthesis sensor histidine kinase RcsC